MKTGFLILLFVGLILMVGNKAQKSAVSAAASSSGGSANKQVEYRYLPRDLDTFLRDQDPPSKVYGSMFTAEDIIR